MKTTRVRSFFAGLLIANSAPHLASAAAGRRHLTPLAGRDSKPGINGLWAGLNLAGGDVLLVLNRRKTCADREPRRWGSELAAFETGYLVFALWMTVSERVLRTNSDR